MNKKDLIKEVNILSNNDNEEDAERLLESYLEKNPNDIDMLMRHAVFVLYPPIYNETKSINSLTKILQIDPDNIDAILFLACITHYDFPDIRDEAKILEMLSSIKTNDTEKLSMIELAKSWMYCSIEEDNYIKLNGNLDDFYKTPENYIQYESALKKSIEFYPYHVLNYKHLAHLYNTCNRKRESIELLKTAIKNVATICQKNNCDERDWTSIQEYFDELVKGTPPSDSLYESLGEYLVEYSKP
jgi:tetratricopeptide (TPR) repeat protein